MALFQKLYYKVLHWAKHRHAPYYLASVSFIESSLFPIPPDVMLIPMVISKPAKAWQLAMITTLASILGGLLGYAIGHYAFEWLAHPFIISMGYESTYLQAVKWFEHYGFFAIMIAGFTPIPYKLFTISAGAAHMFLLPFILASVIGRATRFFLVAGLVKTFGVKIEPVVVRYLDRIGWGFIALITTVGMVLMLTGCWVFPKQAPAPIVAVQNPNTHKVKSGESIYSIAWLYGLDFHELAALNHLSPPFTLKTGEKLSLKTPRNKRVIESFKAAPIAKDWLWPVKGKIIHRFSPEKGFKGLDIAGSRHMPVYAAKAGHVVYAGDGLRGYGNLIIIKHDETYLSAYAHNEVLSVTEGERVKQGQQIAQMGDTGTDSVKLHFEIRQLGQPVDPLRFLPG